MRYIVQHGGSIKVFKKKTTAENFKKKYIEDIRYDYGKTPRVKILKRKELRRKGGKK